MKTVLVRLPHPPVENPSLADLKTEIFTGNPIPLGGRMLHLFNGSGERTHEVTIVPLPSGKVFLSIQAVGDDHFYSPDTEIIGLGVVEFTDWWGAEINIPDRLTLTREDALDWLSLLLMDATPSIPDCWRRYLSFDEVEHGLPRMFGAPQPTG